MSAQRYTDQTALQRMRDNRCPECGAEQEEHSGWGGSRCSLTDNGVAQRISQYRLDEAAAPVPFPVVQEGHSDE